MKRIIAFCLVCILVHTGVEAKDYAKLHIQEMKKSHKYSATKNYFESYAPEIETSKSVSIKDPKLIKLDGYQTITNAQYQAKKTKDEISYNAIKAFLASRKVDNYNVQAYSEDFYKVYRIAERVIRANNLDFINWRLVIDSTADFNAYSAQTNCIIVNAGALDTLSNNEDALALMIGHELAHSILGHYARKEELREGIARAERVDNYWMHLYSGKKYLSESRKMELAADAEGAKLIARAGYDLQKAKELISFLNTLGNASDRYSTHPKPEYRIKSYEDNIKYFLTDEWVKQGRYNIYNSNVIKCERSSNRHSIVLVRDSKKPESSYYKPETEEELYLRFGYMSYLNGEFDSAVSYFKNYLKLNKTNYVVYLYTSYAYEYLYQQSKKDSDIDAAREFASYAKRLAPDNEHVKEQVLAL
ncbi:MAG: hypothetical protein E7Z92_04485 [Cyanobacteria bacterium SIG31]|nr:hypothetical protein [Cyanobacteria bacterium SIG31]